MQLPDGTWRCVRGHRICGAKSRVNPTGVCHQHRVGKNGRCKMHGAKNKAGIAAPGYKNGSRSRLLRHLTDDWKPGFEASLGHPQQAELAEELALTDGVVADYLEQVKNGKPAPDYLAIRKQVEKFLTAESTKDRHKMAEARDEIDRLTTEGAARDAATERLGVWTDRRARLAALEQKRLKDAALQIAGRAFRELVQLMLIAVARCVPDPTVRLAIQAEVTKHVQLADAKVREA